MPSRCDGSRFGYKTNTANNINFGNFNDTGSIKLYQCTDIAASVPLSLPFPVSTTPAMLSESFVASFSTSRTAQQQHQPIPSSSSTPKDAGIVITELSPGSAGSSSGSGGANFKNSSTEPNCLAVNGGHVFAAQTGKAVVHVYSRERGNQEATVPFPERIRSVAVTGCGEEDGNGAAIVILGTEGGKLILWETFSGRQISTPASHLQPITSLVVDSTNNFILSGSEDANIHVWSLPALLSFSNTSSSTATSQDLSPSNSPLRTLSNHSAAITSIAVGHSASRTDIAISCSRDSTALVWEYRSGKLLRTYILPYIGISLELDPADRAVYVGYEDGSVQQVDFFKPPSVQNILHDASQQSTPSQPSTNERWCPPPSSELGPAQCLTLSYDGMTLLSGHRNGSVARWDVAKGRFAGSASSFTWPVTNLRMLPPTGLRHQDGRSLSRRRKKKQPIAVHTVVKPRLDHALSNAASTGIVPASYTLHTHITSSSPLDRSSDMYRAAPEPSPMDKFSDALTHPSFSPSLIAEGLMALTTNSSTPAAAHPASPPQVDTTQQPSAAAAGPDGEQTSATAQAIEQETASLKQELSAQESARRANVAEILDLRAQVANLEALNSGLLDEKERWLRGGLQSRSRSQRREVEAGEEKEDDGSWTARRMKAYHEAEAKGLDGNAALRKLENDGSSAGMAGTAAGGDESDEMDSS